MERMRGSVFIFFFSSRRRHTRFKCDWSSDVCSSDLYLSSRPDLRDVAVICANAPSSKLARIMARYGFEAIAEDERLPIGERIHRFGEDILISLIMYARHARALRLASPGRVRGQIFLSRRALEERSGSAAERYPKLRWRHEYS